VKLLSVNFVELVLENAAVFKKCIDAIAVLIDEAEFIVDKDALWLKATDPSQISMVDFKLDKSAFKHYRVENLAKVGLDLDYLAQIMSRAKPSDELTLALDETKSRLMVSFNGASKRSFAVPLIDVNAAELPTPKIEFDSTVKMLAGIFQDGLKDAELISSHITVGVGDDKFFLKANSSKGSVENETSNKEKGIVDFKAKKDSTSMFPLSYLNDMLKVPSADTEITVQLKTNAPIKISYPIGKAEITYFLAPRIEGE